MFSNRLAYRFITSVAIVIAPLCVAPAGLRAVCLTGWNPLPPQVISIILTNPTCTTTVTIDACIPGPTVGPPTQYYINNVGMNPQCLDGLGNPISLNSAWMTQISIALIEKNPGQFTCQPCPNYQPDWRVSWGTCMRNVPDELGNPVWTTCFEDYRCTELYEVCCLPNGKLSVRQVFKSGDRECDQAGCVQVCS